MIIMPSISSSVKLTKLMTQNFEVQRHCQSVQHLDSDAVLQFINHFVIVFHHSRWYQNITTLYNAHTRAIYHAHNVIWHFLLVTNPAAGVQLYWGD